MSRKVMLWGLCALFTLLPMDSAWASHFRGGNVNVAVTPEGEATFTYETLWRKGSAFFPFDGIRTIDFYAESDTLRSSRLARYFIDIGVTTVFRDVSDPAYDFRRQVAVIDLSSLGLGPGRYVARFENCCRIRGIANAPESSFSLEALVDWGDRDNGSPVLNSRILTTVGQGLLYRQNLNAFDPDGQPLSYELLLGSGRPTYGPSSLIPGMTLDSAGLVEIPPQATAQLRDVNIYNPAGDYVFKVRVTDADGVFSERDVLLDVVATDNIAPRLAPIGNRVIEVGDSLVLPVSADDENVIDRVTLTTSRLPDNAVFVSTPGNPASGTLAFRPGPEQVGSFGINVEARDDGTPSLTASELVSITVLDPNNACPVLGRVGSRNVVVGEPVEIVLAGADPDAGQTLAFSAAFLPPGASFDPATRTFLWTPAADQEGQVFLGSVFEVRDDSQPPCADREVVGFSVAPANRFPELAPLGDYSVAEGTPLSFTVSATDPDGDNLVLNADPLPLGATFDPATGALDWTPVKGQAGVYQVTVSASDDGVPSLSDSATVRITVGRSGDESIRFVGLEEGQVVAGTVLVEAQVVHPLPIQSVDFYIDGQLANSDAESPWFLGGEDGSVPTGYDTGALVDGSHVLQAVALDSQGGTLTAPLGFVTRNQVPPEVVSIDGLFAGAVASGVVEVRVEAIDDQQVAAVEFLVDGVAVNTATSEPYYLNGTRLPQGTFDVSCAACLQVGDRSGDLVVVAVEYHGSSQCETSADTVSVLWDASHGSGTPDGSPPPDETSCDDHSGRAKGLCTAFCEAQDCDAPGVARSEACEVLRENFARLTGEERLPCEDGDGCLESLTLALASDPDRYETFDHDDFTGEVTTFELNFPIPVGFDTSILGAGEHVLEIRVVDNQGLVTTELVPFFVVDEDMPGLGVSIVEPAGSISVVEGRLVSTVAVVEGAEGPVRVIFYADGQQVAVDGDAPFETTVVADSAGDLTLHAVAYDDRGPRQSPPLVVNVVPRPVEPAEVELLGMRLDPAVDGRVGREPRLTLVFSGPVDGASVAAGLRLTDSVGDVPLDVTLDGDGSVVSAAPFAPLAADELHEVTATGILSLEGAPVPRARRSFVTFPDVAVVTGQVLDSGMNPLPGLRVHMGTVETTTGPNGAFRLSGVPTGTQFLHIDGGTIDGRVYPPMEYLMEITTGIAGNALLVPAFLPPLDIAGGLDVLDGYASGGGVLTSSQAPGMSLDLRASRVLNADGTPFSGRMSISRVPSDAVPMPSPVGVFSNLFVTVQPGGLHLDPPAPITYPNLDGALPGEQVGLWHFDHDVWGWVNYGTATVSADAALFLSDPGVGLPATGWGSPAPPLTFTTVSGTVVDDEGNPLHGCRVVSGNIEDYSDDSGNFSLDQVPAGRQGTPRQVRATATCMDIEGSTYTASSASVTAVQNGSTPVGQVRLTTYAPMVGDELKLHSDYQDPGGRHFLRQAGAHAGEQRYDREVEELQQRLQDLGFRQGGSTRNHGQELQVTGTFNAETRQAVRLFQTLELLNGNSGGLAGDGIVGPQTLSELNGITEPTLWDDIGHLGGEDYACPAAEVADGYGTPDLGDVLAAVATAAGNDASNPAGGDHPDHGSHETGVDIDISLPRTDNGGCPGNPGWGRITVASGVYDRDAMRRILRSAIDSGATTRRWLNDAVLAGETHNGQALCTFMGGHDNHLHLRIDPSAVAGGVNAAAAPVRVAFEGLTGSGLIRTVRAAGAGPSDVPVDAVVILDLAQAFDPSTLNASTVRLEGPGGAVQGEVVVDDSGRRVDFVPVVPLALATAYEAVITSGAVLADGTLLAQPSRRTFTTEPAPSLRVASVEPPGSAWQVDVETEVRIHFDGPVEPTSVRPGSFRFRDERHGVDVPVEMSVSDDRRTLRLQPVVPLTEMSLHTLSLTGPVFGRDGSPLVARNYLSTFTTGLSGDLVEVTVAPREVVFSRSDLSPVLLSIVGTFADGSTRNLAGPLDGGTDYALAAGGVATASETGTISPVNNGQVAIDVTPSLPGSGATVLVRVDGVFPEVRFQGRQFGLEEEDRVVLEFSEPVDRHPLAVSSVVVTQVGGTPVDGTVDIGPEGRLLAFDPLGPLPLNADFEIAFELEITDDLGQTYVYPRRLPFSTAAANLGFELGDFTGFITEGDVEVVDAFGPLTPPEGAFMCRMSTQDTAVDGTFSRLQALDLRVPAGSQRLVFTYNFFTDEIEQGFPFNDYFRVRLVMPDGEERVVLEVTRDQLRFSGFSSPLPEFDRMTGFRTASVPVDSTVEGTCTLVLEMVVSDAGDSSIDSAVLVDDIHFE